MNNMDYNLTYFPTEREIVIDAGYLGTGRHVIYALLEVDVTLAREKIQNMSTGQGRKLSFTAFIVTSFSKAVDAIPQVHGTLD